MEAKELESDILSLKCVSEMRTNFGNFLTIDQPEITYLSSSKRFCIIHFGWSRSQFQFQSMNVEHSFLDEAVSIPSSQSNFSVLPIAGTLGVYRFSPEPKVRDFTIQTSTRQFASFSIYCRFVGTIRLRSWRERISGSQSRKRFFSMNLSGTLLRRNLHGVCGNLCPDLFSKVLETLIRSRIHDCVSRQNHASDILVNLLGIVSAQQAEHWQWDER
jgi:hypothetical protein